MKYFRATHRLVTLIVVIFTLYLAFTGTIIQWVDLRSIFTHAPANDPNVMAMREAFDGGGGYAVRTVKDYSAEALPKGVDFSGMLQRTMQSARLTVGDLPFRWVEFRMDGGRPVGLVEAAGRFAEFDGTTGQIVSTGLSRRTDSDSPDSLRNTWKHLHRMTTFGNYALIINVVVGIGLMVLIVTGLVMYFKMLETRQRSGMSGPFWQGGGTWRTWHRGISIVASLFLVVVSLSGLWLAVESLYFGFYMGSPKQKADNAAFAVVQRQRNAVPPTARVDPMSPEAEPRRLAAMQHDIGLTDDQMVKVKAITDDSVQKNAEFLKPGADPGEVKRRALHGQEADAIKAILPDDEKVKFQAWRDAQLIGTPVPAGPRGGGGAAAAPRPQGQAAPGGAPRAAGGAPRAPGGPGGPGAPGGPAGAGAPGGGGGGGNVEPISPMKDAEIAGMLQTTLAAEQSHLPDVPIKVVRVRVYAGMPQGVVVTGGTKNSQMVYNAQTGKAVSETEPGYPPVGFPFGWQAHQTAKDVHRGGIIGISGRLLDFLAGIAMFYLSVSGIAIYVDLWKKRRRAGKTTPVWV